MNPFEDDTKSDGEGDVTQHLVSPHLPFDLELCLRILIELGFNEQVAKRVLEETSDLNSSLIKLHEKIKIARIDGLNDEVAKLWRSPFSARVGAAIVFAIT